MSDINPTKTLDVRGLYCPEPVFRTKIEMDKLSVGNVLKIIADDPDAEEDITRWVDRNGHDLIKLIKEDNQLIFLIKKSK
ncbi:MAG: sulfurtransferase TusA family protein [Candidatus Nitrosocaldaceae archaeon]